MSIKNTEEIDAIGISKETGAAILTLIDEMTWTNESRHLILLQDKLNSYIEFIEDGQLYEDYPLAIGKQIQVDIHFAYAPTETAVKFLFKIGEYMSDRNINLTLTADE